MTANGAPADGLLKEVPGWRRVSRTRLGDADCVTRVLLSAQVPASLASLVEKVVLHGHGSMYGMLPEDLLLTLEGYRVAARLPSSDPAAGPWTSAVAAGVDADGHITISTRWIEGTPLHKVAPPAPAAAEALALGALRILASLHQRLVAYGDFKSENLVLRPDGTVALIDLDTLREVASPISPAATRDLTRSWAAPEQEHEQRTYLASDLWAWARLVDDLFPGGAPEAWRLALQACRQGDPLRRPRTDAVLAHLETGASLTDWLGRDTPPTPGTHTERVPEGTGGYTPSTPLPAAATVRVTDPGADRLDRTRPTGTVPRVASRFGCLHLALLAVAAPLLLCGGGWFAWERVEADRADTAADDTMVALKANKTRFELNHVHGQADELRAKADDAWEIHHTPRAASVRALATIWSQGWQNGDRKSHTWSDPRYAAAQAVLADLLAPDQPEALLARATVEGGVCRLHRLDPTATVHCTRALQNLEAFQAALPEGPDANWLRVEGAWTAVLVESELAAQSETAHLPDAADHNAAGRAYCAAAEPWIPYAPPNGKELLEDCLLLAGSADAFEQYFRWSDLLVTAERADPDLDVGKMLAHLYAGAGPGCESTTVEKKRGDWQVKGPAWCVAVGHAARHCPGTLSVLTRTRDDDPDHPWNALAAAIAATSPQDTCVH